MEMLLQTCAQRLVICESSIYPFKDNLPNPSPLHTFEIRDCCIDGNALLNTLSRLVFAQLTCLVLDRLGVSFGGIHNFAYLSDGFEKYLPNLETLVCTNFLIHENVDIIGFRSFRALSHLQALEVDLNLMTKSGGQSAVLDYRTMFPCSLAKLEFTNIKEHDFEMICRQKDWEHDLEAGEKGDGALKTWQFATDLNQAPALQSVVLHITRNGALRKGRKALALSDTTLSQLQTAADNVAACGVSFRAIGHAGRTETQGEILIDNVPKTPDPS
jgi:hypothetical protein